MTQDTCKTKHPKKVPHFGLVWYPKYQPEGYKLNWFPTKNSLMLVAMKKKKSLGEYFTVVLFEKDLVENRVDQVTTKQMKKAYTSKDYVLITQTPEQHFANQTKKKSFK